MIEGGIHSAQLVLLLLLLFVVAFAALAQKLGTPYPIVLVIAGLLLGFVPGVPRVTLNPDIVFLVVLPPLLYAGAWVTSWREFSYNLVSILSLAVGLVGFTVAGVALAAPWIFPGFDWRLGFVLGSLVATTDAIAATSIAKKIGLPQRIVDVLEGESLLNDATGLLALEFATAMVVYGQRPTLLAATFRFVYLSLAGIAVGLLLALIVEWIEHRIEDGPIEIAFSIMVPYATYLAAEGVNASGVLAVVAAGLYLSRKSSHFFSPAVRLQIFAVWNTLTFILNGLVFVLIGLQLPFVVAAIRGMDRWTLILDGALFSLMIILVRMIWVFPGAHLSFFIRNRLLHQKEPMPNARQLLIIGWSGMRGVIALAAALSLPQILENGQPFPQRELLVFLTFSVILVSLVLQGLLLPPMVRVLGLAGPVGPRCEELEARRLVIQAALERLNRDRRDEDAELYDDLAQHYRNRLDAVQGGKSVDDYLRYVDVSLELLKVERQTALQLRHERRINDEVLRQLEKEMDLSETRLREGIERDS